MNMLLVRRALILFVFLSLLCGVVYPLVITSLAQVLFPYQANGSVVVAGSRVAGSELIGQMFAGPEYFHGRPSAAEPPYNASGSAGSNLGPSSALLMEQVRARVENARRENGMAADAPGSARRQAEAASGAGSDFAVEPSCGKILSWHMGP
jgi:K+-transporting ATPase ATPase C chain